MSRVVAIGEDAAAAMRAEIARAGGNEVCFAAGIDDSGRVVAPRAVARGHGSAVLAATRGVEPGSVIVHNHPSGDLTPSEADLEVAARLYADGLGLAIIDNDARDLYVVVEPPPPRDAVLLPPETVMAALAPGGPVSLAHGGYEDRPGQRDLAHDVALAYNQDGIALAEAGTGTGKSIAYLVPAVMWAVRNRERTVVSTNTINLQEQLVGKDLPFLRRALGVPFRFALVKGRHNYISIRRARLAAMTAPALFEDAATREVGALLEWIEATRDGSLQDLPFDPDPDVWDEVVSDPDACLRTRCPHFDQCFFQRARRDATAADILVANHHLLFSDLAVRHASGNYTGPAVLPPYRRVILDEAHNIEDAATSHLGARVTRRGVARALSRLERRGRGLLSALDSALRGYDDDGARRARSEITRTLRPAVENARERFRVLFDAFEALADAGADGVVRLGEDFAEAEAWREGPAVALEGALMTLDRLASGLRAVRELVLEDRDRAEALTERVLELNAAMLRIVSVAAALRTTFGPAPEDAPVVRWIERRGGGRGRESAVSANAAPIEIGGLLRASLFDNAGTVVMTSATLATRSGFGFIRGRLGLETEPRSSEGVYESSFDFATQSLLAIPTDVPLPGGDGDARFDAATAQIAEDLARITDGGVFLLFTSYRSLRQVAATLRARGAAARWPLFVQGEAPRTRLLRDFVDSGRGILLGVASFWEGVDVPGEPLRGLLITRIPFKVPTEPLTAARMEAIERRGGSSFGEYTLPTAALRLKQGFGRLIRSTTDRGVVVLLDRRVLDKPYGKYLLASLPPAARVAEPWAVLQPRIREFYGERAGGEGSRRSLSVPL
jgi:ATP-dependent DNA helicase DinG